MNSRFTIHQLIERIRSYGDQPFLATADGSLTYSELTAAIDEWHMRIGAVDLTRGVVGLATDYSLQGVAALLTLWHEGACVALLPQQALDDAAYTRSGHLARRFVVGLDGRVDHEELKPPDAHPLLDRLHASGSPGMILFSSGSSGEPKAVLHDLNRFLTKFETPGKRLITFAFLVFDHVAGQDTLLYTLNSGGTLVAANTRRPRVVAKMIERHAVQVLPASPTFLNLLLASHAHEAFDLRSLEIITYGSEPMSQEVLDNLADAFPHARVIQKYGTSEFGAIRSQSKSNTSLYINIKQDETEAQVRDGLLWIRSPSTMLGYLNADALFDEDGWICTGDMVEQDGDWLKILGRASDLINVGGEKVIPSEVEARILELDFVADVTVRGEANPLAGSIVVADVLVTEDKDVSEPALQREVVKDIRRHCRATLEPHKAPVKVHFVAEPMQTERQKKIRR